jgi:eukaryotic-like serine/threonine-protein kinase
MIGAVLDARYRLDAELGRGGISVVYQARDLLLERNVAAKLLCAPLLDTEGRTLILHEARAAAKLNHPNVVTIYDAGEAILPGVDDPMPFIVMELVAGPSLHQRLPGSLHETLRLAVQICAALEHAHGHGIVHRDLKPENVLLAPVQAGPSAELAYTAKLNDFGLARSMVSRLTSEGTISGTVFYLAPELALGQEFDGRSDLYALGVMLYELTTGELPFTAADPVAVISQHLHAPVVPPRARNAAIPATLDALILRLLNKRPDDRPRLASEVAEVLERLVAGEITPALFPAEVQELSMLDRIARGRLVARQEELAHLRELWRRAAAAEGHVLLVSGEPGVGKSRLVRELVTQVQVSGDRALVGECYADGGAPYAPFGQIARRALEHGGADGLALPDFVLADLVTLAPALRLDFPDVSPNPTLEPESEQQRLFESVVALCAALSARGPLLLVLEDGHWAGSGTLAMLRHLARRTRRQPVLIVVTYREVELDETRPFRELLVDLNRERLATHLQLPRLDREGTRQLLAALFAEEITPEFLDGIYQETEGNPFFIEEVCKALVESGSLTFSAGKWDRPSMDRLDVPQSLRLAIQSRVERLPGDVQQVLQMAAILGREFSVDLLAEAMGKAGVGEEAVMEALETATRAQLIEEVGGQRELHLAFVHALIAATLADEVPTLRRRRLHRHVAEVVERLHPEDYDALAHHYAAAADEEPARTYSTRAGDRAAATYANAEAERHYQAALELIGDRPGRAELLTKLGVVQARQGRYEEALDSWRLGIQLFAAAGDRDGVASLCAYAGRAIWDRGDTAGGLAMCREAMAAVARMAPEPARTIGMARLLHETARACHFNGLAEEAASLGRQALELAEQLGAVELQAESLTTLAILPGQPPEEAVALLGRAVELAEAAGLLPQAWRAENNLGTYKARLGDLDAARAHLLRAAELAHRMGSPAQEFFVRVNAAGVTLAQGLLETAEEELQALRRLEATSPVPGSAASSLSSLEDELLRYRGQLTDVADRLQAVRTKLVASGDVAELADLSVALAEIQLERGKEREAEEAAREAMRAIQQLPATSIPLTSRLGAWYAGRGELDQARHLLSLTREEATAARLAPLDAVWLTRAEAHLAAAEGRWPAALAAFESLATESGRLGARWYRAWIVREWAEALLARGEPGDPEQALSLLGQAAAEFQAIGAPFYAERATRRMDELAQR